MRRRTLTILKMRIYVLPEDGPGFSSSEVSESIVIPQSR